METDDHGSDAANQLRLSIISTQQSADGGLKIVEPNEHAQLRTCIPSGVGRACPLLVAATLSVISRDRRGISFPCSASGDRILHDQ
jgi:hypothetical protein